MRHVLDLRRANTCTNTSLTYNARVVGALKFIGQIILILFFLDMLVLLWSLAQLGIEGSTGYWAPFWRVQVEWIASII